MSLWGSQNLPQNTPYEPLGVAYGTPQRNIDRWAGVPKVFHPQHQLGTSHWSPMGQSSYRPTASNPPGTNMLGNRPTANQSVGQNSTNVARQNGFGQQAHVGSSITPRPIYQPWMTQTAANTVQAQADQASNVPYLMKMFDRPGVSRSDAHFAAVAPLVAENQVNAATARASIPFEDSMANERNLFMGQVARENESLQWGNLMARIHEANQQNRLNQTGRISNLLSGLVG